MERAGPAGLYLLELRAGQGGYRQGVWLMNSVLSKEGVYLRNGFKDNKGVNWLLRFSNRIGAYPLQHKDVFYTDDGKRFETTRDLIYQKAEEGIIK